MLTPIQECVRTLMRMFHNDNNKTDPNLLNYRASTVRDYYKNFPFIVEWKYTADRYLGLSDATEWCMENCRGQFTTQIHRVSLSNSYSDREEWAFNEIGGQDLCFWAFTNEQDAIMFSLKW